MVLVVDDDKKICNLLSKAIRKEGYSVATANNGHAALRLVREKKPTLVFLDIKMPELSGIEVLKEIKKVNSDIAVIMLTGYNNMRFVVETMKCGAYDYIAKPFKLGKIRELLKRVEERHKAENVCIPQRCQPSEKYPLDSMHGQSFKMLEIYKTIGKMASVKTAVLIRGESGTGKELVAKAIHLNSSRENKPFVAVDCASLPPTLLESELFGHERGSFTGAIGRKIGKFEAANDGTLFLDEVGNLHLDMQVKLLRALQEKEVVRIGGHKPVKIDVRIIAATNQDLEKAIAEGKFKLDLYYRLNVVSMYVPPLRVRREDIPFLAERFLDGHIDSGLGEVKSISKEALDMLVRYDWPGNVRELENVIERAIVIGKDKIIWPEDLPKAIQEHCAQKEKSSKVVDTIFHSDAIKDGISFNEVRNKFEEDLISVAFKGTSGNLSDTAKTLNISLRSLRYLVKKYGLKNEVKSNESLVK